MIFRKYRFTSKLMITYALLTVIPMALLGVIAYSQYSKSIERQVGEYIPRILNQASDNLGNQMRKFANLSDLIYNSSEVIGILRKDSYRHQAELLRDKFDVESYLTRAYLSGSYSDVMAVFIHSKNRLFHVSRRPFEDFDFEQGSIPYGQEFDFRGSVKLLLPREANLRFEGDPPYLLIVRQIVDFDNRKILGTMFVAVELGFMDEIFRDVAGDEGARVWVMSRDGKIIYHTDPEQIGVVYDEARQFPVRNGTFKAVSPKPEELYSVSVFDETDWTLVYNIPLSNLTGETDRVQGIAMLAFIGFVSVTVLISVVISWRFTRPLNRLSTSMKDVERGNFHVDVPISSKDEVGLLAHRFNSMVREIRDLIRKNYQIELRQKEAELYALQFQINPHFMYNTLETIAMAVEEDQKETVVEMVTLLGRMLRFSLSNLDRFVPIEEEVQHVRDYLSIQKIRFEQGVDFVIQQQGEIRELVTPKFVLQPLVENAIRFGLEHVKKVRIEIGIDLGWNDRTDEEAVIFTVADNGIGMDPDRLEFVRNSLESGKNMRRDSGFGLVNVHSRLVYMFGEGYGIHIESDLGQGTRTTITIPVLRNEEDGEKRMEREELAMDYENMQRRDRG